MRRNLTSPRWHKVLIEIYRNQERSCYCEKLNRAVKGSLTHLREIVKSLARLKLIEVVPSRKIKRLVLTRKGEKVIMSIMNIRSELR